MPAQVLGAAWHKESREVRAKYKGMANQAKLAHLEMHPGYHYQPRKPSNWSLKKPHGHTLVLAMAGAGMAIIGTIASFLDFFAPPS